MKHPKSHTDIYGPRERDELPPGCCYGEPSGDVRGRVFWGASGILVGTGYTRAQSAESAWLLFGEGPREAYLDMKAKAERCEAAEESVRSLYARLESALKAKALECNEKLGLRTRLAEVTRERDAARGASLSLYNSELQKRDRVSKERIAELRAQLAEVTRERDEALNAASDAARWSHRALSRIEGVSHSVDCVMRLGDQCSCFKAEVQQCLEEIRALLGDHQ